MHGSWFDGIARGLNDLVGGLRDYPCFQCRDKCITYSWRCDGEVDCYGAEDESHCEYICPYATHHRCSDTGLCVDNHDLCDGHYDCENGEDERNCGHQPWLGKRGVPIYQDKARSAAGDQSVDTSQQEWSRMGFRANSTTVKKRQSALPNRITP